MRTWSNKQLEELGFSKMWQLLFQLIFLFLIVFGGTVVWTQGHTLLLYQLSHTPRHTLVIFEVGSHVYAQANLDRHTLPHPAFCCCCCWDRVLLPFLPRLASNCEPPNLCLPSTWDHRCGPLCLALISNYWFNQNVLCGCYVPYALLLCLGTHRFLLSKIPRK
jgi:hypothetical protein